MGRDNTGRTVIVAIIIRYSEIPLLRPPKIKTSSLLKTLFAKFYFFFFSFSTLSAPLIRDTTFGTAQKWSLRPLLDSPKGGLNIGILLYSLREMDTLLWVITVR